MAGNATVWILAKALSETNEGDRLPFGQVYADADKLTRYAKSITAYKEAFANGIGREVREVRDGLVYRYMVPDEDASERAEARCESLEAKALAILTKYGIRGRVTGLGRSLRVVDAPHGWPFGGSSGGYIPFKGDSPFNP